MSSDPTNQFGSSQYGSPRPFPVSKPPSPFSQSHPSAGQTGGRPESGGNAPQGTQAVEVASEKPAAVGEPAKTAPPVVSKLTADLQQFNKVALAIREQLTPAPDFQARCRQAFDVANDLFGNAPTWVCFYRELLGGSGMIHRIFASNEDLGAFLRTEEYHQIQLMLTALRSRDLPENDPNDPQRMITVRLPKSLHEAMCEEAGRLNISVNRLCISRMLQMLDPKMIPETNSKPRGRKPRTRSKQ